MARLSRIRGSGNGSKIVHAVPHNAKGSISPLFHADFHCIFLFVCFLPIPSRADPLPKLVLGALYLSLNCCGSYFHLLFHLELLLLHLFPLSEKSSRCAKLFHVPRLYCSLSFPDLILALFFLFLAGRSYLTKWHGTFWELVKKLKTKQVLMTVSLKRRLLPIRFIMKL